MPVGKKYTLHSLYTKAVAKWYQCCRHDASLPIRSLTLRKYSERVDSSALPLSQSSHSNSHFWWLLSFTVGMLRIYCHKSPVTFLCLRKSTTAYTTKLQVRDTITPINLQTKVMEMEKKRNSCYLPFDAVPHFFMPFLTNTEVEEKQVKAENSGCVFNKIKITQIITLGVVAVQSIKGKPTVISLG